MQCIECDSPSNNVYDSQYSLRPDVSRLNQPTTHKTTQPALIATRQYIIVILGLPQKPSNTAGSWLPFRGRQAGRRPSIYGKAEEYVIPTIIIIKCITPTTEIPSPHFLFVPVHGLSLVGNKSWRRQLWFTLLLVLTRSACHLIRSLYNFTILYYTSECDWEEGTASKNETRPLKIAIEQSTCSYDINFQLFMRKRDRDGAEHSSRDKSIVDGVMWPAELYYLLHNDRNN